MKVMNFSLDEYIASDKAARFRITNELPENLEPNAWATLELLQKVRDHLSKVASKDCPVTIISGYRCQALNSLVGGTRTSDHMQALAADIRCPAFGTATQVARELAKHVDELGIGQLIMEFPGPHAWVHVSPHLPSKMVNRIITINDAGTTVGINA